MLFGRYNFGSMIRIKAILLGALFLWTSCVTTRPEKYKLYGPVFNRCYPIYFEGDGFEYMHVPFDCGKGLLNDTIVTKDSRSNYSYKFVLKDKKGTSSFWLVDGKGVILVEGNFIKTDVLLKKISLTEHEEYGYSHIYRVVKYYRPLPDGKWVYRNKYGDVTKTEEWKDFKLIFDNK